jgi:hypothetical protein
MPQVEVSLLLPYLLHLSNGRYDTPAVGGALFVTRVEEPDPLGGPSQSRTQLAHRFNAADPLAAVEIDRASGEAVDRLLRATNHFLRWYRCETQQAAIAELSRAQASPFKFTRVADRAPWREPLIITADPPRIAARENRARVAARVRRGLRTQSDPPVAELFLLDAEQSIRNGRFREAVLFCWSTIDATFNAKYEEVLDRELAGEWASGRDWFKDHRFGMKNKMTAALYLIADTSLFRELGEALWDELADSYTKRNNIIHRGATAAEADAERALRVARRVVEVMDRL